MQGAPRKQIMMSPKHTVSFKFSRTTETYQQLMITAHHLEKKVDWFAWNTFVCQMSQVRHVDPVRD